MTTKKNANGDHHPKDNSLHHHQPPEKSFSPSTLPPTSPNHPPTVRSPLKPSALDWNPLKCHWMSLYNRLTMGIIGTSWVLVCVRLSSFGGISHPDAPRTALSLSRRQAKLNGPLPAYWWSGMRWAYCFDGWMDGSIDVWMDDWMGGWTDRKTDWWMCDWIDFVIEGYFDILTAWYMYGCVNV